MSLAEERRSIVDYVAFERRRVVGIIAPLADDRPDLQPLTKTAIRLFDELDRSLGARLDELIAQEGDRRPDVASEKIQALFRELQTAIGWLAATAHDQVVIPRELYRLLRWFMSAAAPAGSSTLPFVLKIEPVDLGTAEWRQVLSKILFSSRGSKYPALEEAFRDHGLVFIQVPAPLADINSSVHWPLIFHECVHALELTVNSIGAEYPNLPRDWTALNAMARTNDVDARNALVAEELTCDEVALACGGPGFAYSLVDQYATACGVAYQQLTHPRFDIRVDCLVKKLVNLGFNDLGDKATKRAGPGDGSVMPAEPCIESASRAATKYIGSNQFNRETRDQELAQKNTTASALANDLKVMRPAAVSPPTLFSVTAFSDELAGPAFGPLLADMVRLWTTEQQFKQLGLKG